MSEEAVRTETYKGFTIKILPDNNPEDPREWDNLGTMVTWHRRASLGDVTVGVRSKDKDAPYFADVDELRDYLEQEIKANSIIYLPLYLYEHSGMTMRTRPFGDPWDSGQVGFIYVTKYDVLKETMHKRFTKKTIKHIEDVLRAEVATYDAYLTGAVYGWEVSYSDGEVVESVWGYYDSDDSDGLLRTHSVSGIDQAIEDAKSCVDGLVNQEREAGVQPYLPATEPHFPAEVAVLKEKGVM